MNDWTVLKVIKWTSEKFRKTGISSHGLDSELLIAHALETRRINLYINYDKPLGKDELASIRKLIRLRLQRIPVAHIIGKKEFMSLEFKVERNVFIPRSDTETLVEYFMENFKELFRGRSEIKALDACAGTGCIGISLMKHCEGICSMDFIEKDPAALRCLEYNCSRHLSEYKYMIVPGDLIEKKDFFRDYGLITCNPPYIPEECIDTLQSEVKDHHSHLSLSGGSDGLKYYREFVPAFHEGLDEGGVLGMEIGLGQHDDVIQIFKDAGLKEVHAVKDINGIKRHIIGKRNR